MININTYLFIIIFLILGLYLIKKQTNIVQEEFLNYFKCHKYKTGKILSKIFKENTIPRIDKKNADIYIPCGYTHVENELKKMKNHNKYIFGIDGCDSIVSKYRLWRTLEKKYGLNGAIKLVPETYDTTNFLDIRRFVENYSENSKYILKKDIQAQKGLKISNDMNLILKDIKHNDYIVVQKLLEDPFLINGRKINIRVYFLIVCKNNSVKGYIHTNGFLYYTKDIYNKNSLLNKHHITTGYIDREVYARNPLTTRDLYKWLDYNGHSSKILEHNTITLFKKLMNAFQLPICKSKKNANSVAFQLFGCDVAPDKDLNVKLIEINKGPDLGGKDERDIAVKRKVLLDIFNIVGIIPSDINYQNEFIDLW